MKLCEAELREEAELDLATVPEAVPPTVVTVESEDDEYVLDPTEEMFNEAVQLLEEVQALFFLVFTPSIRKILSERTWEDAIRLEIMIDKFLDKMEKE